MSEEKELSPVVLSSKDVENIISLLSSADSLMNTVTDGLDSNTKMMFNLVFSPVKLSHLGIATVLGSEALTQYFAKQEEIDEKIKKSREEKEASDSIEESEKLKALLKILN